MKNILSVLGLLFIMVLWFIPVYCFHNFSHISNMWGMLWIAVILLTILYGILINEFYNN